MSKASRTTPAGPIYPVPPTIYVEAAIGRFWGSLNLLLGAISVFRLVVRGFDLGLSAVMEAILRAYVQVFHGALDFVAISLFNVFDISFAVPVWAKDWIILYFVCVGAVVRVIRATDDVRTNKTHRLLHDVETEKEVIVIPPAGAVSNLLMAMGAGLAYLFRLVRRGENEIEPRQPSRLTAFLYSLHSAVEQILLYLVCIVAWPLAAFEMLFLQRRDEEVLEWIQRVGSEHAFVRFHFSIVFIGQITATVVAIGFISFLNAATM